MDLSQLKPAKGSTKKKKRRGRGEGSGLAVTAGRGHKGYGSRGGSKKRAWFEGGQMPLQRRVPKFGFTNINKVVFQVVNVGSLETLDVSGTITKDILYENKLIRKKRVPVKLLGEGDLTKKLTIEVDAVSKTAKDNIEKLGGAVNLG
ncbi:MAG: 50S ribosomal protein L15 [Calditrichaceae bacterium]